MEPQLIEVDWSDNYMSMCKEAVQIQKVRMDDSFEPFLTLKKGDWYVIEDYSQPGLCSENVDVAIQNVKMIYDHPVIWLPTMSQLKSLFSAGGNALEIFMAITDHWQKEVPYLARIDEQSGEQLMLAWYMRQRHGLKWTGNSWVKDEPEEEKWMVISSKSTGRYETCLMSALNYSFTNDYDIIEENLTKRKATAMANDLNERM